MKKIIIIFIFVQFFIFQVSCSYNWLFFMNKKTSKKIIPEITNNSIPDPDKEYPIADIPQPYLPYNDSYDIKFFSTEKNCKNPESEPEAYCIYSEYTIRNKTIKTNYWAKVTYGSINHSNCTKGIYKDGKISFQFIPNNFGTKRIAIILFNSKELGLKFGGKKVWNELIEIIVNSYQKKLPVTLCIIREDESIEPIIRAEDLSYMNTVNYIELSKRIQDNITLNGNIIDPIRQLDNIYEYFKDNLKQVILIVDSTYVVSHEDLTPYDSMIPLYWNWNEKNVPFFVLTDKKCKTWEILGAKECLSTNTLSQVMKFLRQNKFYDFFY